MPTAVRCRWLDPPPQLLVHVDHELQSDTTQEPPAAAVAPNARTARENLNDEELQQEETVMALYRYQLASVEWGGGAE